MVIKILELSTLTQLTEEEQESCKGGIGETVPAVPKAVAANVDNTTTTTFPVSISGVEQVVALTTEHTISHLKTIVVPKQPETT